MFSFCLELDCFTCLPVLVASEDESDQQQSDPADDDGQQPDESPSSPPPGQNPPCPVGPPPQANPPAAPNPAIWKMSQAMMLSSGAGLFAVLAAADARMGPRPVHIPSERSGGESRRSRLKRKAADITRSTCETFAFLTSRTHSQEDAAARLSFIGNVRVCMTCLYCHILTFSAILCHMSISRKDFSPGMCNFEP